MRCILMGLIVVILAGCAQSSKLKLTVRDGEVFWARSLGSGNQEEIDGNTTISGDTPGGASVPAINALFVGSGMLSGRDIEIINVKEVYIEEAGTRNQGVQVDSIIKALYVPGDPFDDKNTKE